MRNHLHDGFGVLLTLLAIEIGLVMLGLLVLSLSGMRVVGSGYFALTLSLLALGLSMEMGWLHWRYGRIRD